ncbi:hypothetical protein GQR58_010384 [Nymphon striatum]|nr:hypothetical protein GQR58_010384 [Nymphon striatum]
MSPPLNTGFQFIYYSLMTMMKAVGGFQHGKSTSTPSVAISLVISCLKSLNLRNRLYFVSKTTLYRIFKNVPVKKKSVENGKIPSNQGFLFFPYFRILLKPPPLPASHKKRHQKLLRAICHCSRLFKMSRKSQSDVLRYSRLMQRKFKTFDFSIFTTAKTISFGKMIRAVSHFLLRNHFRGPTIHLGCNRLITYTLKTNCLSQKINNCNSFSPSDYVVSEWSMLLRNQNCDSLKKFFEKRKGNDAHIERVKCHADAIRRPYMALHNIEAINTQRKIFASPGHHFVYFFFISFDLLEQFFPSSRTFFILLRVKKPFSLPGFFSTLTGTTIIRNLKTRPHQNLSITLDWYMPQLFLQMTNTWSAETNDQMKTVFSYDILYLNYFICDLDMSIQVLSPDYGSFSKEMLANLRVKDKTSADFVKRQLKNLIFKVGKNVQSIFTSRKIASFVKTQMKKLSLT